MTSVSSLSSSSDLWASYRAARSSTVAASDEAATSGAVSGGQRPSGRPPGPPPAGGGGGGADLSKVFDAADTDGDGTVSAAEAKALQTKINESRSTLLSLQESGGTAASSDATDITDLFSRMDEDGDGSVSSAELSNAKTETASRRPPPPGQPPSDGSDATTASGTSTTDASGQADDIVKLLDTSGDGTISKDEISFFLQSMMSGTGATAKAA